jgi:hypothetical protein
MRSMLYLWLITTTIGSAFVACKAADQNAGSSTSNTFLGSCTSGGYVGESTSVFTCESYWGSEGRINTLKKACDIGTKAFGSGNAKGSEDLGLTLGWSMAQCPRANAKIRCRLQSGSIVTDRLEYGKIAGCSGGWTEVAIDSDAGATDVIAEKAFKTKDKSSYIDKSKRPKHLQTANDQEYEESMRLQIKWEGKALLFDEFRGICIEFSTKKNQCHWLQSDILQTGACGIEARDNVERGVPETKSILSKAVKDLGAVDLWRVVVGCIVPDCQDRKVTKGLERFVEKGELLDIGEIHINDFKKTVHSQARFDFKPKIPSGDNYKFSVLPGGSCESIYKKFGGNPDKN